MFFHRVFSLHFQAYVKLQPKESCERIDKLKGAWKKKKKTSDFKCLFTFNTNLHILVTVFETQIQDGSLYVKLETSN